MTRNPRRAWSSERTNTQRGMTLGLMVGDEGVDELAGVGEGKSVEFGEGNVWGQEGGRCARADAQAVERFVVNRRPWQSGQVR